MIPGEMVIEELFGLQCTGITLSDRFGILTAEHLGRAAKPRRRPSFNRNQNNRFYSSFLPNQNTLRMAQVIRHEPVQNRLGTPGLRRFGSEGNLLSLQRSNSFGSLSQFSNRIPWRQSNSNLSRAGSVSNLSQASWHGRSVFAQGGRRFRPFRGRQRSRGRQVGKMRWQRRAQGAGSGQVQRGGQRNARGRGRGGFARNQQNGNQQKGNQQNRNQQNRIQQNRNQQNRNQQPKTVPTKEELDAQLDDYMAKSQLALDKELDEYMLRGSLMDFE